MPTRLVSVIIPVYNAEKYLTTAVNSVLVQSYNNIEIIIINDGSTDDSKNMLEEFYSSYENIKIIHTTNQGQSAACNLGFRHAQGDYIKFLDSDDFINEVFIEQQVKLLKGTENTIASASWGRFYNDDINTFQLNPETVWRDMKPIDWIVEALENGSNMLQCALWLIPRKIISKSGLWNEELDLNNDFDFFVRILLASNYIKYSSESILYYRSGMSNSLSQQKSRKAYLSGVTSNLLGTESILAFENSYRTRQACAKNLSTWMFQTYYTHRDLGKKLESKIEELALKKLTYGARTITKKISLVVGWKRILWLKYVLGISA